MFKFLLLLFLSVNLFAINSTVSFLQKIDDKFVYINDDENILIGSSGIILQNFQGYKTIIARVNAIEKENGLVKLVLIKNDDMLAQKALPKINSNPKVGDEVIMNFLYNRALLIAPNAEIYNDIEQRLNEIYFINPDIFSAYMVEEFLLSPDKTDFKNFCVANAIGLLGIALENKVSFFDCQDFTLLFEEKISKSNSPQTPFYSGITNYRKNFFDIFEREVKDYYQYYNNLIRK